MKKKKHRACVMMNLERHFSPLIRGSWEEKIDFLCSLVPLDGIPASSGLVINRNMVWHLVSDVNTTLGVSFLYLFLVSPSCPK